MTVSGNELNFERLSFWTDEMRALAYVSDNIVWYYVSFIARIVPFFGETLQNLLITAIYNAFK